MLNHTSPMPFGKYEGVPMQDVPAPYLHHLWETGVKDQPDRDIHLYIRGSLTALQQEDPDKIWSPALDVVKGRTGPTKYTTN